MSLKPSAKEHFLATYGSYRDVDSMIGSSDDYDRAIAHHIDLHKDHEDMLKSSNDNVVHGERAERSSDPEVIDKASKHEIHMVRSGVVYNPHATSAHLESALNHFNIPNHIFSAAVIHPNASKHLLTKLTDRNFNPNVSSHRKAYERLEKKDHKE